VESKKSYLIFMVTATIRGRSAGETLRRIGVGFIAPATTTIGLSIQ